MAAQSLPSWKRRIGLWGIGHTANFLMVKGFDLLLYPLVILYFGLVQGAAVMWILSALVCYTTLKFYDWSKTDWLGIETLKEVKGDKKGGIFHKLSDWILSRGDLAAFLIISIKWDPFICVVYMRRGAHQYNGMTWRDWKIFWISLVISNGWWTVVVFTGLTVGEWLLHATKSAL